MCRKYYICQWHVARKQFHCLRRRLSPHACSAGDSVAGHIGHICNCSACSVNPARVLPSQSVRCCRGPAAAAAGDASRCDHLAALHVLRSCGCTISAADVRPGSQRERPSLSGAAEHYDAHAQLRFVPRSSSGMHRHSPDGRDCSHTAGRQRAGCRCQRAQPQWKSFRKQDTFGFQRRNACLPKPRQHRRRCGRRCGLRYCVRRRPVGLHGVCVPP